MAETEQITALRSYLRVTSDEGLADAWDTASALVLAFVGSATVPEPVLKQATLKAAAELFHQRSAPQGIAQFADQTGAPVRTARDPLVGAYPLLRPFVGLGIG
jgi:hypothetical protein